MDRLLQKIRRKTGGVDLVELLSTQISGSELQSVLLEVYRKKSQQVSPGKLLRGYRDNRFVGPVSGTPIELLELEVDLLKFLSERSFLPIEFSPLAPLGTSSVVAPVDQNNVISALRGTEVVSDVTNLLALETATRRYTERKKELRLCAAHRLVRSQKFDLPGFTPHFKILSLVTSGRNRGSFDFETTAVIEQLQLYRQILLDKMGIPIGQLELQCVLFPNRNQDVLHRACQSIFSAVNLPAKAPEVKEGSDFTYYQSIRFKIIWRIGGREHQIVDGGLVDWVQKLLQDKKERFLISGVGTEYLLKIPHL